MLQMPNIFKGLLKDTIWRMNPADKKIYLTFDDGPNPKVTPQVLDILDKFDVKATFFCVGENVSNYPELFNKIKNRGHQVGNHTFNHLKGFGVSVKDYVENIRKADKLIESSLFRPPHGQITPAQVKALKDDFKLIMWDFITYDYDYSISSPQAVVEEVKKRTRNGSIVVFHDSLKAERNVLTALPEVLEYWQREGYEVCALAF